MVAIMNDVLMPGSRYHGSHGVVVLQGGEDHQGRSVGDSSNPTTVNVFVQESYFHW